MWFFKALQPGKFPSPLPRVAFVARDGRARRLGESRRAVVPYLGGPGFSRPYHFPARIQSFQAFAAPFAGESARRAAPQSLGDLPGRFGDGTHREGSGPLGFAAVWANEWFARWRYAPRLRPVAPQLRAPRVAHPSSAGLRPTPSPPGGIESLPFEMRRRPSLRRATRLTRGRGRPPAGQFVGARGRAEWAVSKRSAMGRGLGAEKDEEER